MVFGVRKGRNLSLGQGLRHSERGHYARVLEAHVTVSERVPEMPGRVPRCAVRSAAAMEQGSGRFWGWQTRLLIATRTVGGKIVLVTDDYRIQEDSHTLRRLLRVVE